MFLCGARSASSTVGRRFVLDMVVICFDLFILRIYCARSTGKQCWPRWLHLHVCVLLQFECRLIGPQQLARVPRHRWWRRKCRSFWPHRGVVHPRGRRKDGHVISFRFFSFIRHHPQTHEACCQPNPILCWFLFGKPDVSERNSVADKPTHCWDPSVARVSSNSSRLGAKFWP